MTFVELQYYDKKISSNEINNIINDIIIFSHAYYTLNRRQDI